MNPADHNGWSTQLNQVLKSQVEDLGLLLVQAAALLFVVVGASLLTVLVASRVLGRGRERAALGAQAVFGIRLFAVLLGLCLLVLFLYNASPLLATVMLGALAGGALVAVGFRARAWLGGAWIVLRGRVRTGNRLSLPQGQGVVEAYGLFHLMLRADNGDQLHVPLSALHDGTFAISAPERAVPVELHFVVESEQRLTELRWAAQGCPYRDRRANVQVIRDLENPLSVRLRLRSWSQDAAERAADYLRRQQAGAPDR